MTDGAVRLGPALAGLCVVFALASALLVRWADVGRARDVLTACARAAIQLAGVSLVISAVLRSMTLTAAFVGLMLVIAAATSAHRVSGSRRPAHWWTIVPVAVPVLIALSLIVASTVLPPVPVAVLPVAGIVIGGAMTATSLAGRRAVEELRLRAGEYDAARALGLSRREGVALIGRPAAALALIPVLDQTRTVGLVTLPGAFVGVLLAGADPWQAGTAQLLVLVSLVLVQAMATVLTVELIGRGLIRGPFGRLPE
ncbi:ABC transporter permease [Nakamurella deserti]|uniref:ABC transporter permease n=1 Tax=Nakamurella deserti TaxID=2164074 RepID=UPI0013006011|nr:ABC transporter permease [Nakamurella deserti]